MTLLLTSDLNGQNHWYEWLVNSAKHVDAICVAGDLVNPFRGEINTQREMVEFMAWQLGGNRIGLFACEGDQDLWGARWHWLKSQTGTRRLGNVTVTSVPWKSKNQSWLDQPWQWSRESGGCWLVLAHQPPPHTAVAVGPATELLGDSIGMNFSPNFVVSGHMRHAPWLPNGSWWDYR